MLLVLDNLSEFSIYMVKVKGGVCDKDCDL